MSRLASHNDIESSVEDDIKKDTSSTNKEDLLIGYEQVSPSDWSNIPYGTHIRYLRKDGTFRPGGYIRAMWKQKDKRSEDTIKVDLFVKKGRTFEWSVFFTDIDSIWKKPTDRVELHSAGSSPDVQTLTEDVEYLKAENKQLNKEIQKINYELVKMATILRKYLKPQ